MTDLFGIHSALSAAQKALDGLSLRQKAVSQNIANVDTPGYRSSTVRFEDTIRAAVQRQELTVRVTNARHIAIPSPAAQGPVTVARVGGSERADGNNVDIDAELIEMTETGISYQALSQAASKKLALLKSIAVSR